MSQLGRRPSTWSGAEPNPRSTPPPRSSTRAPGPSTPPRHRGSPSSDSPSHAPPTPPRRTAPETPPRRSAPQSSPPRQQNNSGNYDPEQVGRTRRDSLGIFLLPSTATEREIKVQYRRLARKYHPDKYHLTTNTVSSEMTELEAQVHFQLISNAYEFLRTST